jgi:hypothetical protein
MELPNTRERIKSAFEAMATLSAHRQQPEQMAETWMQLADARKRQLEKQGKSAEAEGAEVN